MRGARGEATWLCPDEAARQRLLDMDARLLGPRALAFTVLGLAVASTVPQEGVWPVLFLLVVFAGFAGMTALGQRMARPEYAIFGNWVFAQVMIAVAAMLTGGPESYAIPWLLVPIVTLPARFGSRGVAAGVVLTALLLVAVTLAVQPSDPGPEVYRTIFPVAGLLAAGILSTTLMRSDLVHRTKSVLDGLTGMLNRRALEQRLTELEGQAAVTGRPIAVLAGDIDRFKAINDEYGHAAGDDVLVDIAYRLRKQLRAFDLAYRVGGEEFLVLLPGATVHEAAARAEQLRAAVAAEPVGGLDVTISFGVAASEPGAFDRDELLAAADRALYEAKAAGRNRVVAVDRAAVAA
jgi:diguanylate cyclase (GGDEF)-like protein